jgi:hypothetical protein
LTKFFEKLQCNQLQARRIGVLSLFVVYLIEWQKGLEFEEERRKNHRLYVENSGSYIFIVEI